MESIHSAWKNYRGSAESRTVLLSTGSFIVNALIGIGKLVLGFLFRSPWFVVTAVYYLLLCGARGQVLWRYRQSQAMENPVEQFVFQFKIYQHDGIFLCLLGISYFCVCVCMAFLNKAVTYPFYILYGVVAVAFYKVGTSVYGIYTTRRRKMPLLSILKILCFVDACVSIVAVQCALLAMEKPSAAASSAFLGMGCSFLFICIGVWMMLRKNTQ